MNDLPTTASSLLTESLDLQTSGFRGLQDSVMGIMNTFSKGNVELRSVGSFIMEYDELYSKVKEAHDILSSNAADVIQALTPECIDIQMYAVPS